MPIGFGRDERHDEPSIETVGIGLGEGPSREALRYAQIERRIECAEGRGIPIERIGRRTRDTAERERRDDYGEGNKKAPTHDCGGAQFTIR